VGKAGQLPQPAAATNPTAQPVGTTPFQPLPGMPVRLPSKP